MGLARAQEELQKKEASQRSMRAEAKTLLSSLDTVSASVRELHARLLFAKEGEGKVRGEFDTLLSTLRNAVGALVGAFVGAVVGAFVGAFVGTLVGAFVGTLVGAVVVGFCFCLSSSFTTDVCNLS